MKTHLRLEPHSRLPGEVVVELWWGSEFVGTVVGADHPGVRVISKFPLAPLAEPRAILPRALEVRIFPGMTDEEFLRRAREGLG